MSVMLDVGNAVIEVTGVDGLSLATKEEQEKLFNSGGAGGYAQPSQYVQVLAALLNDGKSPKNGAQILKPETVKLMWENQIPQHPDFAREGLTAAKAEMSNPAPEMYPQEGKLTD